MFACPLCEDTFPKRKDLDAHLATAHADNPTPYACGSCTSTFSTEKARKVHLTKRHGSRTAKRPRPLPDCPFVGTLTEWVTTRYNASRATAPERLSASTIARIEAFASGLIGTLVVVTEEAGKIMDDIDAWMDADVDQHEMQTVNNHVRYLRIYLLYLDDHCDSPNVDATVLEYMDDLVADTQSSVSREVTTLNMLKLEDPFALARIRDTIVNALLREQVDYIDPCIRQDAVDVDFGVRLRNWLELAIRFTNIPCRIQCSRELRLPTATTTDLTYVAKLVLRDGQYCRLINQDKSAASHQPLLLPLGPVLSAYLHFYIARCRPAEADHGFVFCTRRGTRWSRPSRDLKRYLETVLGIDVYAVDPTGRFIHGSRAIMMAFVAIGVNFDQPKMHGFARLMRHSSTTNERFYSMWQQRALSNQAIDVFSDLMGLDLTVQAPVTYAPVHLRLPPPGLRIITPETNVVPYYGTRSVGTQTGVDMATDTDHEVDLAGTIPPCRTCAQQTLVLYGPFGSARRRRYFGRYFLACPACHRNTDGRFTLADCLWYPLGHSLTPTQKSQSSRPRNMAEIEDFIQKQKTT